MGELTGGKLARGDQGPRLWTQGGGLGETVASPRVLPGDCGATSQLRHPQWSTVTSHRSHLGQIITNGALLQPSHRSWGSGTPPSLTVTSASLWTPCQWKSLLVELLTFLSWHKWGMTERLPQAGWLPRAQQPWGSSWGPGRQPGVPCFGSALCPLGLAAAPPMRLVPWPHPCPVSHPECSWGCVSTQVPGQDWAA